MGSANEIRGEVDLELDGQSFVLRPSHEAIVAMEAQTGLALVELAIAADGNALTLERQAIVTTECVKAWGRQSGDRAVAGVNQQRIRELIFEKGVLSVLPRLALVLTRAATGGCKSDGSPKDDDVGEAMTAPAPATGSVNSLE